VKSVKSVVSYFLPQQHRRHHHWPISSLLQQAATTAQMAVAVQLQGKWNVGIIVVEENGKPLISLMSSIGGGAIARS
jgi:hypothetical protein